MDEIVLANGCLRAAPFDERVVAASAAGVRRIGLGVWDYMRFRDEGWTDERMKTVLEEHDVRISELEAVLGFAVSNDMAASEPIPGLRYADVETETTFFAMADTFGATLLQAVGTFDPGLEDDASERFAALCDRANEHGLSVALEFVPTTNVPDAAVAARIVAEAGRRNGGICVDSWHHFRGANDDELLRSLPPERVFMIQVDDGAVQPQDPDFLMDTLRFRAVPGEAQFDLVGFLQLLWQRGVEAPISVEVMSDELDRIPPREAAMRIAQGTRAVLAAARAGSLHDQSR